MKHKSYLPGKTKSSFFLSPTNEGEIECDLILLSDISFTNQINKNNQ